MHLRYHIFYFWNNVSWFVGIKLIYARKGKYMFVKVKIWYKFRGEEERFMRKIKYTSQCQFSWFMVKIKCNFHAFHLTIHLLLVLGN
jgi:hypothetical protein